MGKRKAGRVGSKATAARTRDAAKDLSARKGAEVGGGTYNRPVFLGGVRVASADVNSDGGPTLKLAT